jgi:hypothetical protein
MSKTKKTVAKKSAAKRSTKPVLSKEQLVAIMKRVESGQSGMIAESKKLGFKYTTHLHNALTELLGGKTKYDAMLRRAVKARGAKKEPKQPVKKAAKKTAKKTPKTEPVQKEPVKAVEEETTS